MSRIPMITALLACQALVAQTPANAHQLSLKEALRISLENNLQVEIARQTRTSAKSGVDTAAGAFDWTLTGNVQSSRQEFATESSSTGNKIEGTQWNRSLTLGVQKPFGWGGNLQMGYAPTYTFQSANTGDTLLPYGSSGKGGFTATYTQSLLKGFGRDASEVNLIVARKTSEAADYQYRQAIINLVASTETLYWNAVYAQQNLENARQALALAQKQLNENKIRVQVGTLAPIEVTSAEAAVAQREQAIIAAEASLQNAKDALIRALYPGPERPDSVETTDAPNLSHISVDEPSAEQMALDRRVELKIARLTVESNTALAKAAENKMLPQLDAYVGYSGTSYQYTGLSDVNSDLTGFKYPGYMVGVNLSVPLGNRAAKGNLAAARANQRGSEFSLKDQELGIRLEVRQAFRNVEATEKGVDAARKTRIYREQDLDAEQKKFDNGMSTNFLVLSKQTDLDTAKAAELQAQINYVNAVTALEKAVGDLLEARGFQYPE